MPPIDDLHDHGERKTLSSSIFVLRGESTVPLLRSLLISFLKRRVALVRSRGDWD